MMRTGTKGTRVAVWAALTAAVCMGLAGARAVAFPGGGGGGSADNTAAGVVIKMLDNGPFNGTRPKGKVTLGYAADNTAQSMDFALTNINVPDGTVIPVKVICGRYAFIISYYTYWGLVYTTTNGTLKVSKGSVTLSLNKLNGDVVPDFPLPTIGTTEIQVYAPNGALILDGSVGKLRP